MDVRVSQTQRVSDWYSIAVGQLIEAHRKLSKSSCFSNWATVGGTGVGEGQEKGKSLGGLIQQRLA